MNRRRARLAASPATSRRPCQRRFALDHVQDDVARGEPWPRPPAASAIRAAVAASAAASSGARHRDAFELPAVGDADLDA